MEFFLSNFRICTIFSLDDNVGIDKPNNHCKKMRGKKDTTLSTFINFTLSVCHIRSVFSSNPMEYDEFMDIPKLNMYIFIWQGQKKLFPSQNTHHSIRFWSISRKKMLNFPYFCWTETQYAQIPISDRRIYLCVSTFLLSLFLSLTRYLSVHVRSKREKLSFTVLCTLVDSRVHLYTCFH